VAANPSSLARTGALIIARPAFPISQAGAPCTYALTPANRAMVLGRNSGIINVIAPSIAIGRRGTTNSWITLTSSTNGATNGILSYSVGLNTGLQERHGARWHSAPLPSISEAAPC